MRVLLDACMPERLRLSLQGLEVQTARFARLDSQLDRDLLDAIEGRFDVLVTCDQNLSQQQSMSGRKVAVVVLCARTNRLADLLPLVPALLDTIEDISAGEVRSVGT